jgi:thiol-disulfide isomerase/thioredoxin
LKVGAAAPAIKLKDAEGNDVSLEGATGKKNMLLFWSPTCGFCKRMADDLKAWEKKKPAGAPDIYLVSSGSAEENKAQGFKSTILLDSGFATGRTFGASGTPSAILIDENGKVASDVVVGAPAVLDLAKGDGKAEPVKSGKAAK